MPAPAGAQTTGYSAVCGVVENAAGWPIEDVLIRYAGIGTVSAADVQLSEVRTQEDGSFRFFIRWDRYQLVFLPETDDGWGVPAYDPAQLQVDGRTFDPGCDFSLGIDLGTVTLLSPRTSLVDVLVDDLTAEAPLAGATANMMLITEGGVQSALSADDGIARMTCPIGMLVSINVTAEGFEASDRTGVFPCLEPTITKMTALWRAPVAVGGVVTDQTTSEPIAGATVRGATDDLPPFDSHYVSEATTGAAGEYALALPWGADYDLTVTRAGFENGTSGPVAVTLADLDPGVDVDLTLQRLLVPFTAKVVDIVGDALPATVTFEGPAPVTTPTVIDAPTGNVSVALQHGSYDVTVASDGKNGRACTLVLSAAGGANVTPPTCFSLLAEGKAGFSVTVLDETLGGPLAGAAVDIDGVIRFTDADGTLVLEPEPGLFSVSISRDAFLPTTVSADLVVDELLALGEVRLMRATIDVTFSAFDVSDGGATVQDADICAVFNAAPGASGDGTRTCGTADAAGNLTLSLAWTELDGGAIAAGSYDIESSRDVPAPLFDAAVCLPDLVLRPGDHGSALACPMSQVPALTTLLGPFIDAHTGAPVAGVGIEAATGEAGDTCSAPYICSAITDAVGEARLFLPEGHSFDLTATHADYQDVAPVLGAAAGGSAFANASLLRHAEPVQVDVVDPHTSKPIDGAAVVATGVLAGFVCDPGSGGFVCAADTVNGTADLSVPWGTFNLSSVAGSYDVLLQPTEPAVDFLAATGGPLVVPVAIDATATLRPLRAPQANITLTARFFDGTNATGVAVKATTQRTDGFVCDPLGHDSAPAGYAGCKATVDATAGLALPAGTVPDHEWRLDADLADHFRETVRDAAGGDAVDLILWPLRFDLEVDPRNMLTDAPVSHVRVCIQNLDHTLGALGAAGVDLAETCKDSLFPVPIVFENVTWTRDAGDPADTTDLFRFSAEAAGYAPAHLPATAGPAKSQVRVGMVPLEPTVPSDPCVVVPCDIVDDPCSTLPCEVVPEDPCDVAPCDEVPPIPDDPCTLQENVELCEAPVVEGLALGRVTATTPQGPHLGRWVLLPPVVGATPGAELAGPAINAPNPADVRHDGTWTVVYIPGTPSIPTPLTLTAEYTAGGEARALVATVPSDPSPGAAQPPYVWQFNLHTEETVFCAPGPAMSCGADPGGVNTEAALRARFYVQGLGV